MAASSLPTYFAKMQGAERMDDTHKTKQISVNLSNAGIMAILRAHNRVTIQVEALLAYGTTMVMAIEMFSTLPEATIIHKISNIQDQIYAGDYRLKANIPISTYNILLNLIDISELKSGFKKISMRHITIAACNYLEKEVDDYSIRDYARIVSEKSAVSAKRKQVNRKK